MKSRNTSYIWQKFFSAFLLISLLFINFNNFQMVHAQGAPSGTPSDNSGVMPENFAELINQTLIMALDQNPYGISLLSSSFESQVLTIDLSEEAHDISDSEFEMLMDRMDLQVNQLFEEQNLAEQRSFDYFIKINGQPFSEILPPINKDLSTQIIDGKKIVLSPGHGWYYTGSGWALQRVYYYGIVEDYINLDIVSALGGKFAGYNATIKPTRELNKNAGNHSSGKPWWQMDASEYVKSQGAPSSVWGTLSGMDRDIMARPLYGNWVGANSMISIHNNGGGGCGTETWYETGNGYQAQSLPFAQAIHNKIISRLRSQWNSSWCDRGVKGANGRYGENNYFHGPAVIIELGFMDNQSDNSALQNSTFRDIVATAIRDAVVEYYGGSSILPSPSGVSASDGTYNSKVGVSWSAVSGATSYEVWRNTSNTSSGAIKLGTVPALVYDDTTAIPGTSYYYWVKACNSIGCSNFSTSNAGYRGQEGILVVNPASIVPAFGSGCSSSAWQQIPGYNGASAYLTLNTNQPSQSTNSATWQPNVIIPGIYKVEAFIAYHGTISSCNGTTPVDTSDAHYSVTHANGTTLVSGNQLPLNNEWLNLGNYSFTAGTSGKVKLTDLNDEANLSRFVSFSAVRFSLVSASDVTPPTVLGINRLNPTPTNSSSVELTVTFSEPVTGVGASDFSLTTSGIVGASITSISSDSGAMRTVTISTGSGNGTIRLDLADNNSIVDAAGNPLGGAAIGDGNFTTGQVYTINKTGGGDTTGVFRPGNGLLYLKNANTSGFANVAINYGTAGDYPVAGDWDGNGTATIGIYRNGIFYLRNSNTPGFADLVFTFGQPGDQPVAGDWNGDGVDTIGVYRNGLFLLRNSNSAGASDTSFALGNPGDVGIAGDWNGDGMDTTGVFRPGNGVIFLKNANTSGFADVALNYGLSGDRPVTGDWNDDGIDTIGVYRNAQFLLRNSNTIGFADIVFALGNPGDMPIAGNWDGLP